MSARGNLARQLFTTPERRKYIARKAAAARWYRPTDEPIERIECYLRPFKNLVAQAMVENQPGTGLHAALLACRAMNG